MQYRKASLYYYIKMEAFDHFFFQNHMQRYISATITTLRGLLCCKCSNHGLPFRQNLV